MQLLFSTLECIHPFTRMEWSNAHVAVVQRQAAEEDEEVEAPHHLAEAADAKVRRAVIVREVACFGLRVNVY